MAKKLPESGRLDVKGLGRIVAQTHLLAQKHAKQMAAVLKKSGTTGLTVVVPGEKGKPVKGINRKKQTGTNRE